MHGRPIASHRPLCLTQSDFRHHGAILSESVRHKDFICSHGPKPVTRGGGSDRSDILFPKMTTILPSFLPTQKKVCVSNLGCLEKK
jgi:hypothetical protein